MKKKSECDILLTVSIAAYNVEKYLEKTLESCIVPEKYQKQMEVIIVNDGSTDHTYDIAKRYESKYPNLFKIIDKINGGYGSTINASLKVAKGKYFKLLDGDDWFDKNELVKLLIKIERCNADILFMNFTEVNNTSQVKYIVRFGNAKSDVVYSSFDDSKPLKWTMHGIATKTCLLTNNDVKISEKCFYTDVEYVMYSMKYMKTYICFDLTLYQYRVANNGQSISRDGMIKYRNDAKKTLIKLLNMYDECKNEVIKSEMNKFVANSARFTLNAYTLNGCSKENRMKVVELDEWIKHKYPQVYKTMNKGTALFIFRKLKYHFYFLYWLNALRKFK